jgi:hypothetical protein
MKLEIPKNIQEYFKDKYIDKVNYTATEICILYENCDYCLFLKINGCLKNPKAFFHFNEEPFLINSIFRDNSNLESYRLEKDTFFSHSNIKRYIMYLKFDDCEYSFYYYNFCELCFDTEINIGKIGIEISNIKNL